MSQALHVLGTMSADLVWQVIKNNNCFLRKGSAGRHDPVFSSEPGNLYARHSFKHSGARPVFWPPARARTPGACLHAEPAQRAPPRAEPACRTASGLRVEGQPALS